MTPYTSEVNVLVTDWFRRVRESQKVNYEYGSILVRRNFYLGIPAVILSTIVGTAVFTSLSETATKPAVKIVVGLLSLVSAVLATLQTFLNLSDRAAKHKYAGARYGAIRRRLELLKTMPPTTSDDLQKELASIKNEMDEIAAESPSVPSAMKDRIDKKLKSRGHKRIFDLPPES
jgi:hypothetical protein